MFEMRVAGFSFLSSRQNNVTHKTPALAGTAWDGQAPLGIVTPTTVERALAPVAPPPTFRDDLARRLADIARQKKHPEVVLQKPRDYRKPLLFGAAISSLVPIAGLLIAFLRHRLKHRSR